MKKFLLSLLFFLDITASQAPFVIGKLKGQLGNQMFQIAATVSLALDHQATALFPSLQYDKTNRLPVNHKLFFGNVNASPAKRQVRAFYIDPFDDYHPIPFQPDMMIEGYFQSEKYFKHHKRAIIALFTPHESISSYVNEKYAHLLAHPTSVALHIRTYNGEDPQRKTYPRNGAEFVQKAIAHFPEDALFLVFSDDIEWCKKELSHLPFDPIYIEGEAYYNDFYLMSQCKHNIISNSSFSWWAAYLNPNEEKIVIAPKKWFQPGTGHDSKDIIPEEWITLE